MKTPREILLARHQAAEPKLDAIRAAVLAGANTAAAPEAHSPTGIIATTLTLWRELILPSRRAWSGLAAVWILIALINAAQSRPSPKEVPSAARRTEMAASYLEQQKLLGELLTDRTPAIEADRPRTFSPKPRTETTGFKMV